VSVTYAVQDSATGSLLCLSLVLSKTTTGSLLCMSLVLYKNLLQGHYNVCHLRFPRLYYWVISVSVTCAVRDCSTESLLSLACAVQDCSTESLLCLLLVLSKTVLQVH
jgi:hypothetical protein